MKIKFFTLPMIIFLSFFACRKERSIDEIIEKYDKTDFSTLKNKSITYRSIGKDGKCSILLISTDLNKCSPYVVEFNTSESKIVKIQNNLVIRSCGKDYLTNEDIAISINEYSKHNLCSIYLDSIGNVYLNPDKQERFIYLRKLPLSTPSDLLQYKHYKGNWYVRK